MEDKIKVLLIDDEPDFVNNIAVLLRAHGYDTIVRYDDKEIGDVLEKENIDTVLLDVDLGGALGFDVCKKIKQIKPEVTVIMITGFGYDTELVEKAREIGCAGYIGKNMPISQILSNFKSFVHTAEHKKRRLS